MTVPAVTDTAPEAAASAADAESRKRKRQAKKFEKLARRKGTDRPATLVIAPESPKGIKLRCVATRGVGNAALA